MNWELHNSDGTLTLLLMSDEAAPYCRPVVEVSEYMNGWLVVWMAQDFKICWLLTVKRLSNHSHQHECATKCTNILERK